MNLFLTITALVLVQKIDQQPVTVVPGASCGQAPSDALVLFDGKDTAQWSYRDARAAQDALYF